MYLLSFNRFHRNIGNSDIIAMYLHTFHQYTNRHFQLKCGLFHKKCNYLEELNNSHMSNHKMNMIQLQYHRNHFHKYNLTLWPVIDGLLQSHKMYNLQLLSYKSNKCIGMKDTLRHFLTHRTFLCMCNGHL